MGEAAPVPRPSAEDTIEISIPPRDLSYEYDKYKIYAYAVSLTDEEGRKAVFLVQLTCGGVTLALDLDSKSKNWRFYDGDRDGVAHSWVYPQGGKRDAAFRAPKVFSAEDDKMPSGEFKRNLLAAINELVNIKPRSDESIKQFGRKILALLMRDCHLNWVDILPLSRKLTNSLDVTSDESSIKEIVSREICSLFDLRPTAALIAKEAKEGDVNPRGYGKTTAIVRYALQYRNSRSDTDYVPFVVCADARRPNAFKKLKELSRGGVNGYTPDKEEGAIGGLDKALGSFKKGDHTALVIMDVNARHLDEIIQKLALMGCDYSIIVVLDGTVESKEISHQIEICKKAKLMNKLAFIITKMDLHLGLGAIMTAAKGRYPIAMIGTGEAVGDYIYEPDVESFLRECLSFDQTQISSDAILQESAENSLSSSKEAGEEINWDSPKIGSTKPAAKPDKKKKKKKKKPAAKEQILDTQLDICIDTKEMNTNETDQEPSKVEEVAKRFFDAHIKYVIEGNTCLAKYLDDRDVKDFVTISVFPGDTNTRRFYQSVSHTNLLPYRFEHSCDDGGYNFSFAKLDESLESFLTRLGKDTNLISKYTLLSNKAENHKRLTTKFLPPRVRTILKDIICFMDFLLKNNQEVKHLNLLNMGVKDGNVMFYDLPLCERTGSASKLGVVFSKLIVSIFKQFGFDANASYDLKSLVSQLKSFKGTSREADFLCKGMALMSPKDRVVFIANLRDKRLCIPPGSTEQKTYQNGIAGMTIHAEDWRSQFELRAPELYPANSVYFHAKQSDASSSSSSSSNSEYSNSGASLLTFCRCMCHHLYNKFHEDGQTSFDTLDVHLTVMALFERELIDVHTNLASLLDFFMK
ncbi:hypothetical protein OROMI_012915 [Orobanche minor]